MQPHWYTISWLAQNMTTTLIVVCVLPDLRMRYRHMVSIVMVARVAVGLKERLSIPVDSGSSCLSFSHKDSSNLLAVGGRSKIAIISCTLKEDAGELSTDQSLLDALTVEHIYSVLCSDAANITWSPATSYTSEEYRFCVSQCGKTKGNISVFSTMSSNTTAESLPGHMSVVNGICAHPSDETLLASVGDDCVCRVWDLHQSQLRSEFKLGSPGMTVKWHEQDPVKLMVSEKCGRIRFYDLSSDSPILSLDCPAALLLDADWSPANSLMVGGVAGGSWYLWDLSRSSQPFDSKTVHNAALIKFRWCVQNSDIFATLSASSQLRIHNVSLQGVPMSCEVLDGSGLSWHARIPLVAVSCDNEIGCWAATNL